jgi:hypothetical protein
MLAYPTPQEGALLILLPNSGGVLLPAGSISDHAKVSA